MPTFDLPIDGNQQCYTDPVTGKRICISAIVRPDGTSLQIDAPHDVVERLHDLIVPELNKDRDPK